MREQFITYEMALKLKDLGFNEGCFGKYYTLDGKTWQIATNEYFDLLDETYDIGRNFWINAPLWQQIIDWFLSQYNIWISVDTSLIKFYKNDELQPSKFQFVIEDLNNRDADYMFHSADEELFYFDYKHAREQAILKAIEICQKEK